MSDRKPRILLVDDTPANLMTLGEALSSDFDVQVATSGAAGLALVAEAPPNLILLDVMMPDMDGYEVCRRLKAAPESQAIPIIFVTALSEPESEVHGLALGADDYLTKPIKLEIARQRIRNLLERDQLRRALESARDLLEEEVAARTAELVVARDSAESANKELEEFSYSISHDMRSPLRAIDGLSKILLDEHGASLDEEGRRLQELVRKKAQHMGRLIDALVQFLNTRKRKVVPGPVDMAALARDVCAEIQAGIADGGRLRMDVGALPAAWGDYSMIREVLRNLIDNAVKFAGPERQALIEVDGRVDGRESVYSVKDNGVGFDMRYVDKLFKVFERLHPTGQYEGTSIGLALVKRMVEMHGGRVWAEGRVDEGATFYFSLPNRSPEGKETGG